MTDFETRARAAARAVHDAVDAPTDELATHRKDRGPVRALLIAAAVIVVAAVVGTTLVTREEGAGPASDVTSFCAQVQQMVTTPVDVVNGESTQEPSLEFLRDAPEEIRPTALAILHARTGPTPSQSLPMEVSLRFLNWWQLRCYPDAATATGGAVNQRVAPVPAPAGFEPCGASNGNAIDTAARLRGEYGTIAVYGNRTLADPYDGRTVGIVRSPRQTYYSDDHATPFPIPGHPDAELIDATGPFGAAIDGLGPAITWKDDDGFVSVVGRGYTRAQAQELAAIAARVVHDVDGDTIRDAGADQLDVLYRGPVGDIYVQYPSSIAATTFNVSYNARPVGIVRLFGSVPGTGGVEATRFFATGLRHAQVGGKRVLEGIVPVTNTPEGTTAHIVIWTDGGVMLTLSADPRAGPTQQSVDAFVATTHALDRGEWEQLLAASDRCLLHESGDATSSGSGSSAATSSAPSSTSTTTPGARP